MTQQPVDTVAGNSRQREVSFDTYHGTVALSIDLVKKLFCKDATDLEAYTFIRVCQAQGLNPFLREAYLVKYQKGEPASIIIGKETYTQRAERHPEFAYWKAGIVVQRDDQVLYPEGASPLPRDLLLGGWAEVKRRDKEEPFRTEVSLKEYDTGRSTWKKLPATMIRKVALVQGLREAFPGDLAGLGDRPAVPDQEGAWVEGTGGVIDLDAAEEGEAIVVPPAGASSTPALAETSLEQLPLPPTVHARSHLEAVLADRGWDIARLQSEVLRMPLDRYLQTHSADEAYQRWRAELGEPE